MIQTISQLLTFEEYLEQIPNIPDGNRYELFDGVLTVSNPTGDHEDVAGFLALELGLICRATHPTWFVPRTATVKPYGEKARGYQPDVIVLKREALETEPLWKASSTLLYGASIAVIIEVASTNWRDDYYLKHGEYEAMGIAEYWIADFLGLASPRFLGKDKQPAITVYTLSNGEYQSQVFKGGDRILSAALGELTLTAEQVFRAG